MLLNKGANAPFLFSKNYKNIILAYCKYLEMYYNIIEHIRNYKGRLNSKVCEGVGWWETFYKRG